MAETNSRLKALGVDLVRATAGAALRARGQRADNYQRVAELFEIRAQDPRPLDVPDFKRAGAEANIHPARIHATANAETFAGGFDANGRGTILVEPHIFSALTFHAYDGPRFGCSYPNAIKYERDRPPPPGFDVHPYRYSQDERWGLLTTMAMLDVDAAIGSISLGRFQQVVGSPRPDMGWKLLKFPTAESLFRKLMISENDQLEIFLRFFRANGAMETLRSGNWRDIARVYNGPGNVDHYAARLQTEFNRVARHYS